MGNGQWKRVLRIGTEPDTHILRESARSAGEMDYMTESVSSSFRDTKIQNNPLCIVKVQKMQKVVVYLKNIPHC